MKNELAFLERYSQMSGIPFDTLAALFLVLGDDLFFALELLQRKTVKFPSLRHVRKEFASERVFHELTAKSYKVRNKHNDILIKSVTLLEVGDTLLTSHGEIPVTRPIQTLLGHHYLVGDDKCPRKNL